MKTWEDSWRAGGPGPDLLLAGGRVIDPESGHDAVADVAIVGDRIVAVGPELPRAKTTIDCSGLVVCPGFIDLHSHAQSLSGSRLQAFDGVTTALDLECGVLSSGSWYDTVAKEGRPLNYGFSASWALARAQALGLRLPAPAEVTTPFAAFQSLAEQGSWTRPVTAGGLERMREVLEAAVDAGAIGVGMLLGYLPDVGTDEVQAIAAVSAELRSAVFVHSRSSARQGPVTALDAVEELLVAAESTGAHLHLCHLNSTSSTWLTEIVGAIDAARARGVRLSTEAYPYNRGSTVVGAAFLSAEDLAREGRSPSSLTYLRTGEDIADADRLEHLRRADPGGLVLTTTYDETDPGESKLFDLAMSCPHAAFASDAMPTLPADTGQEWPLPETVIAHPRSAGCFTRVLRLLVRERGLLTLPEAVRRCTLVPAEILREAAPGMRWKGRLQPGADADVLVFDAMHVSDRADYAHLRPSTGVRQLIVGGTSVIRDGALLPGARPGRAVTSRDRRHPSSQGPEHRPDHGPAGTT